MSTLVARKAERRRRRLRLAMTATTGGGKTFTALAIASALVAGTNKRVLLVDTEGASSEIYADVFDFDVLPLTSFSPLTYVEAIRYGEENNYGCIIIDSLSHAWMGKDGAMDQVDQIAARAGHRGNSFSAWSEVTPQHNALIEAVLNCKTHLIATMRQKAEYVVEDKNGKKVPRKVGMAPVQRDGMEYEFDICADLIPGDGKAPSMVVTKTRMSELAGKVIKAPGAELGGQIRKWLEEGADLPPAAKPPAPPAEPPAQRPIPISGKTGFWAIVGQWTSLPPDDRRGACIQIAQRNGFHSIHGLTDEQYDTLIAAVKKHLDSGTDWMEYSRVRTVEPKPADAPKAETPKQETPKSEQPKAAQSQIQRFASSRGASAESSRREQANQIAGEQRKPASAPTIAEEDIPF